MTVLARTRRLSLDSYLVAEWKCRACVMGFGWNTRAATRLLRRLRWINVRSWRTSRILMTHLLRMKMRKLTYFNHKIFERKNRTGYCSGGIGTGPAAAPRRPRDLRAAFRPRLLAPHGDCSDIVHLEHLTGFLNDRFCFHRVVRHNGELESSAHQIRPRVKHIVSCANACPLFSVLSNRAV